MTSSRVCSITKGREEKKSTDGVYAVALGVCRGKKQVAVVRLTCASSPSSSSSLPKLYTRSKRTGCIHSGTPRPSFSLPAETGI